jgi:membrane protein implicated in regulation of membrane protease activity
VRSGREELIGAQGTVRVPLDPLGLVFVHGALWRARVTQPATVLSRGDSVRVELVDGLTLHVAPAREDPEQVRVAS